MAKRQIRIYDPTSPLQQEKLKGKLVNLCLTNNSVVFGTLTGFKETLVVLQDKLLRKHKIPFSAISEIIIETDGNI